MPNPFPVASGSLTLDRQISVLYYERLLSSQDKATVMQEAQGHALTNNPKDFLRDPYVLDFLELDGNRYLESDLEQGLINNLQ